jgi:hypothetical protein
MKEESSMKKTVFKYIKLSLKNECTAGQREPLAQVYYLVVTDFP